VKWNVGKKIGAAFGLSLFIFFIVGVVSFRSTTELIEASNARKETYETLSRLDDLIYYIQDIELGQRSYILTGDESYLAPYREAIGKIDQSMKDAREKLSNSEHLRRLESIQSLIERRVAVARETVELRRTNSMDAAVQMVKAGEGNRLSSEVRKAYTDIEKDLENVLQKRVEAADKDSQGAKFMITVGTLLAIIISALAGFGIARNIANPLQDLTRVAERITQGDLKARVAFKARSDEVGVLSRAFEQMTDSLMAMAHAAEQIAAGDLRTSVQPKSSEDLLGNAFSRMVADLRGQIRDLIEGTNVISTSAAEILASTAQLASSASQSATAVTETTTTVEEVRQTAEVTSQKARNVSDGAQKNAEISKSGRKSNQDLVIGMGRIKQQMESIASSMVRLSEQSQAIGQIIASVEDLAAQSNLLAVNAAIEAAKAGEHGKGFGVVAQEVRSLAEQSRQATTQVRTILTEIQKATSAAVMATEQGSKAVEEGERQTVTAGDSIESLNASIAEAAQASTQIAASSQQQLVGMDQVATAMESIKQASSQNVASAKQLESAARNLHQLGQQLKQMVERYKVVPGGKA
jgi:methyl-accepting chemotaxis protein